MMATEQQAIDRGTSETSSASDSPQASTPPLEGTTSTSLPTGLSALIQAATSQLEHLAEAASILQGSSASLPFYENFPERLMGLCTEPANLNTITFLPDGKFFAVRQAAFEESVLPETFQGLSSFHDFLALTEQWGFSRFQSEGIAIFRHPKFVAGDYEQCGTIRYGETPQAARVHALPEGARSIVAERQHAASPPPPPPATSSSSAPKRRLSPRRESLPTVLSSKQRLEETAKLSPRRSSSGNLDDSGKMMDEDSVRSVAKAIAVDKLKIPLEVSQNDDVPLVETAVTSATQEIFSEAIESLLRDEGHSKETFMKHEKELSRSSIPGVVPVCKQLFSSTYKDALSIISNPSDPIAPTREVTDDSVAETNVLQEASNSTPPDAGLPEDANKSNFPIHKDTEQD